MGMLSCRAVYHSIQNDGLAIKLARARCHESRTKWMMRGPPSPPPPPPPPPPLASHLASFYLLGIPIHEVPASPRVTTSAELASALLASPTSLSILLATPATVPPATPTTADARAREKQTCHLAPRPRGKNRRACASDTHKATPRNGVPTTSSTRLETEPSELRITSFSPFGPDSAQ